MIVRTNTPDNLATGQLNLSLTKKLDNSEFASVTLNVNVVNPNVIMTNETNPEVLAVLYSTGKLASSEYLLKSEAASFTDSDFYVDINNSIFTGNTTITHFEEFVYFTGITTLQYNCFSDCVKMTEIVLPNSLRTIKRSSFSRTGLTSITIPEYVSNIEVDAFVYADKLKEILVDDLNPTYVSENGCVYIDYLSTLYLIPPGITSYIMPELTTSVYGEGDLV